MLNANYNCLDTRCKIKLHRKKRMSPYFYRGKRQGGDIFPPDKNILEEHWQTLGESRFTEITGVSSPDKVSTTAGIYQGIQLARI